MSMNPAVYRYAYRPLNRLASILRVKDAARAVLGVAPAPVRRSAEELAARIRMRASYNKPLVPAVELRRSYTEAVRRFAARERITPQDVYLEFGVCHGTSMIAMAHACRDVGVPQLRLVGFDSFEGLPPSADFDDNGNWMAGSFRADLEYTRRRLTRAGIDWTRAHLIKGWFSETLKPELVKELRLMPARIIMVDADTYLSSKEALTFCAAVIEDEAMIFFDDWHAAELAEQNLGEKKAFDEFLAEFPEFIAEREESLRYNQNSEVFRVWRRF